MTLLPFAEHLTKNEGHRFVEKTHIGQAHLAGTGPESFTCRQCKHWYCTRKDSKGDLRQYHPYEGGDDGLMHLQPSMCNYNILNKADRRVPPDAESCRFFAEASDPPKLSRERLRKSKADGAADKS